MVEYDLFIILFTTDIFLAPQRSRLITNSSIALFSVKKKKEQLDVQRQDPSIHYVIYHGKLEDNFLREWCASPSNALLKVRVRGASRLFQDLHECSSGPRISWYAEPEDRWLLWMR